MTELAGDGQSSQIERQFLNCYLSLGIMKDAVSFYLQKKEYKSEKDPH
jgi:hypothetical protein